MGKIITFILISLFIFIDIADASINLLTTPTGTVITFEAQSLSDPIGCIYIDSIYLARLSAEEIQIGMSVIDPARLSAKLDKKNLFRVAVFIEGYSGNELVRKIQASNFVRMNNDYNYLDEAIVNNQLQDFVFQRFTELRQIRAKIKEEGALWKADLTSVFMLSDEDRAKLCGFRMPQGEIKDMPQQPKDSGLRFPPQLDWTNKDGINWMTRVKNQSVPRPAGTCWAFAAVGQVEALINIVTQNPDSFFDLAEQTLVTDCCRYCGDCDGGMNFWALNYIRNNGIPLESVDPYTASNGPCCKRPSRV